MDLQKKLEEIEIKKNLLQDSKNKLDQSFYEDFRLLFTYNSNAIEGNTLSLQETKVVLEGITIGGKTLREHFEVINHQEAIFFIEELVRKKVSISEQIIREIHYLVLKNINDREAGKYRSCNVLISGAKHIPTESYLISQEMEQLIDLYRNEWGKKNAVIRASRLHIFLVKIHPFIDGNGRVARLLLNLALLRGQYTIVLIPSILRHEYIHSLEESHNNPEIFINFIAERVINTQLDLLRLLKDGGVITDVGGANNKDGGVNTEEEIYTIIKNNQGINAPTIANILNKSLRTTQRYLKKLSDNKRIEFCGASKNGGYYII